MIVDTVRGDILRTLNEHIAFAVNTEGFNDAGFAGSVASKHWPGLANTRALGDVMSRRASGRIFHALVCHSLDDAGWKRTPETVTTCLDALDVPKDETVAVVLMGAGPIGQMGGADVFAILGGMARAKRRVAVYTLGRRG